MTTVNNYKSSTIRGLLKNSDYPDGSELADAQFDRNLTVNNLIKSRGSIEVSFDNLGTEETIITLQNNGNINCKTITINGADLINQNNNLTINDATINNNLSVINDVYITNNLNVTNDATLSNNLNVNNDVIIGNDATINNNLSVINNANIGVNLTTGKLFLNDSDINSQGSNLNLISNNISSFFDVYGNFNCNHNMILNNNIISYAVDATSLVVENLFYGDIFSNKGVSSINGFFVKSDSGLGATTYALIDNTGQAEFNNVTVNNNSTVNNSTINNNAIIGNNLTVTNNATINNNLTVTNDATINNNLIVIGAAGGNINCKSISISGTTLIDNNKDMTVHDLTTNKADINSILTVNNVIKPSTTIAPNSSVHLGFIHTISKVSIISTVTTTLTILQNINVNNTTFSYGTYRFKLFFSGSGSISQTMTFCINTTSSLYVNKNGKQTTNTNISTLQYDITLNIYTATTVYFLAQTSIGNYTINDAYIEMVRIA